MGRNAFYMIDRLFGIEYIVTVGKHNPFRIGRRPGGVRNIGQRLGSDALDSFVEKQRVLRQRLNAFFNHRIEQQFILFNPVLFIEQDILLHGRKRIFHSPQLGDLLIGCQHHTGFGMVQAEADILFALQFNRQRHTNSPGMQDAQLADHPIVLAFRQQRDAVARLHAQRK